MSCRMNAGRFMNYLKRWLGVLYKKVQQKFTGERNMVAKADYIPSMQRVLELVDTSKLDAKDLRHVHKIKNYIRERTEMNSVSAAKVGRQVRRD